MLIVVFMNVIASFLLKSGAKNIEANGVTISTLLDKHIAVGAVCYGFAFLGYVIALRYLPLFQAQSMAILQYLFVLIGSYWLFHEVMTPIQVMGCVLLLSGLVCVLFG